MAKKKSNGSAGSGEQKVQVATRGQFIRDLSFENFKAQRKEWQPAELEHEVKLFLDISKEADNRFVVSVKVNLEATSEEKPVYLLEVDYCGLFVIENMPENQLQPYLAVQCPQLLYPFLRRIISDVTRDGGFPPYNMELINFAAIYQKEMMRQRAADDSG